MTAAELMQLDSQYIMSSYGRYPIALARGEGTRAWDLAGKEYLDFLSGIAVCALGHCHPAVVDAITAQARQLIHCSNLYYTEPGVELARLLMAAGGLGKVFFSNSGAEANEGAFKLARKYHWRRGQPERVKIISATHAFHGRTLATLAATPKPEIQEGFGPMPAGFAYVEFGDSAALEQAVDDSVAAVILEPVQGEGGITPAEPGYLKAARAACDRTGALLIFDEIQCGLGRCGTFYAYQSYGVRPDILTLAKGLGGGLPIGAFMATPAVAAALQPGDHGSTFGANPVACAAAVATLRTILDTDLPGRAIPLGQLLMDGLRQIGARHPGSITAVRGIGLMTGAVLECDAKAVLTECMRRGLLANVTAGNILRFLPPLTVTENEIRQALGIVEAAVATVTAAPAGNGAQN